MKVSETVLLCLAVATLVLTAETVTVAAIEDRHTIDLLRRNATAIGTWLAYAAIFLVPGCGAWVAARLASRRTGVSRSATLLVVVSGIALPVLDAPLATRPVLGAILAEPRLAAAAAGAVLLVAAGVIAAARRGLERTLRFATLAVAATTAALSVGNTFLIHRLGPQLLSPAGLAELAAGAAVSVVLAAPLLLALGRAKTPSPRSFATVTGLYVAAYVAIVSGVPTGSAAPSEARRSPGAMPSVLLIVVDTLRADMVRGPEGPTELAPALADLARDAITFERAYSAAPWTTPSFGSILTSAYPSRHHAGQQDVAREIRYPLDAAIPCLAEVLGAAGYWTAAALTNPFLARRFGLDRGFDTYRNLVPSWTYHPVLVGVLERWSHPETWRRYLAAPQQSDRIRALIDAGRRSGRPYFVLGHYMDPHAPYDPPRWLDNAPTDGTRPRDRYRAEVAYCDRSLGELLDGLRHDGVYDDLLIVVTADHGEELDERRAPPDEGERAHDHGHSLFDEMLRVPLLVKLPGNELGGTTRRKAVSLVDVAPTVLDVAGIDAPSAFRGRSLRKRDGGDEPVLFAEGLLWESEQKAAMRGRRKVILRHLPPADIGGAAYDLAADPGERAPLPIADERFRSLSGPLLEFILGAKSPAGGPAVKPDPHLAAQLRALGYVE